MIRGDIHEADDHNDMVPPDTILGFVRHVNLDGQPGYEMEVPGYHPPKLVYVHPHDVVELGLDDMQGHDEGDGLCGGDLDGADYRGQEGWYDMVTANLHDMGYPGVDASEVQQALADDDFYTQAVGDGGEGDGDAYADAAAGDAGDAGEDFEMQAEPEEAEAGADHDEAAGYEEQEPDDFYQYDAPPVTEMDQQDDNDYGDELGENGDGGLQAENLEAEAEDLAGPSAAEAEGEGNEYISTEGAAHGLQPFTGAEGEGNPALMAEEGEAEQQAQEAAAAADAVPTEDSEDIGANDPSEAEQSALLDAIEDAVQSASSNAERKALVQALGHPPIDLSGDAEAKSSRTREAVGDACDAALKRGVPLSALTSALHGGGLFSAVKNGIKKGVQVVAKVAKPVLGVAQMVPGKVGMAARAANGAMNVMGIGGDDPDQQIAQGSGGLIRRVGHAILNRGGALRTGAPQHGASLGLSGGSRDSAYVAAKLAATKKLDAEYLWPGDKTPWKHFEPPKRRQASKHLLELAWDQEDQRAAEAGDKPSLAKNVGDAPPDVAPDFLPANMRKAYARLGDDQRRALLIHYKVGDKAKGSALWHAKLNDILSGSGFARGDNVMYKGPAAAWVPEDGVVVVVKHTAKGVLVENPDSGDRATVSAEHLEAMDDDEFEEPPPPRPAPPPAAAAAPPMKDIGKPPIFLHPSRRGIPMRRAVDAPYADRSAGIAMAGQKRGRS